MIQPGRNFNSSEYRFGFQGQEKDDELKGIGNSISFKYRIHDPRLGRFFVVDPLTRKYPHNSPYAFSENRVIDGFELEGLEVITVSGVYTASFGGSAFYEKGKIYDFSKTEIQIYTFITTGEGVETNASLAIEGVVGYYPDASAQDLVGSGTITSFSAGEGVFGSTSEATTSNEKKGTLVSVGFGGGLIPFASASYNTNTTISPYNQAAENFTGIIGAIDRYITSIDVELESFDNEIQHLNQGIGMTSRAIEAIDSQLKNKDMTVEDRSSLIREKNTLHSAREGYYKRSDEITNARTKLKDQKNNLLKIKMK